MSTEDFFERLGEAGKLKHEVLSRYLPAWMRILGGSLPSGEGRTLHYVDTHSGPGRYVQDRALGSPLLAIEAAGKVQDSRPNLKFAAHLIEAKSEHINTLKSEVSQLQYDPDRISINVHTGDFAEVLPAVLRSIPSGEALFVFIDPFGYDVPMRLVKSVLAGRRYAEVFLTLMSDFMARFASDQTKAATLTDVVGSDEWKGFIGTPGVERKMVELYCRNVMGDPPGRRPSTQRRLALPIEISPSFAKSLYYLLHISHSPKARRVMEKAADGALGEPQQLLFSDPRANATVREALTNTSGTVDVLEVAALVWRIDPSLRWDPHIRKALEDLHAEGSIEVHRHSKGKGYVPRDVGKRVTDKDRVVYLA